MTRKHNLAFSLAAGTRGKGFAGGLQRDITVFSRDLTVLEVVQLANRIKFESIINKVPPHMSAIEKKHF
jgi:hypothetical protein